MNDTVIQLNTIEEALEDIRQGKVIIVVDDEDRENEGDFIVAASKITPEIVNFMSVHGRGLHCCPLPEERCEELQLHMMVGNNTDPKGTAFTVSVDLLGHGVTTGISASDRSKTIRALMDEQTQPAHLSRPGHVFPLRAKKGGVLRRPGHTEAAVDLTKLAGLEPGGVIVEIMNEDGTMARLPQLVEIAKKFDLKIISIEDLIAYRLKYDSLIEIIDTLPLKTHYGDFTLHVFQDNTNEQIHFALTHGVWNDNDIVPVRVKSNNANYDLFSALQYGEQTMLERVTSLLKKEGKGVVVFVNHEVSTQTILSKINHYKGVLTGENTNSLTYGDEKDYGIGAQILKHLGIHQLKLITRHPKKRKSIGGYGLDIVDFIQL